LASCANASGSFCESPSVALSRAGRSAKVGRTNHVLFISGSLALARGEGGSCMATPRMAPSWRHARMRRARFASPQAWHLAMWSLIQGWGGQGVVYSTAICLGSVSRSSKATPMVAFSFALFVSVPQLRREGVLELQLPTCAGVLRLHYLAVSSCLSKG
jgi:hypothetical protein